MMKRSSSIRSFGSAIAFSLLSAAALRAGDTDTKSQPAPSDAPWMQPLIGSGFKTNDRYTDGNLFITAPLWSTIGRNGTLGGDYLFLEPYTSLGEERQITTSAGLGWRHLFSDEPRSALQKTGVAGFFEEGWFVGGNIFGDMLDTQNHNSFWQMGFGGEIGTRYLELDGNYYCPLTGEKLAGSSVSTQTSSSTASSSVPTAFGAPFAFGNGILQPVTTTTTTTTTTSTARTVTSIYEEGMRGWDAQAVALVPWLDQWVDLRINGGYLRFDNQPLGPQGGSTGPLHGWKAGAELRPVPAIVLGGEWYEDKRFAGGNWVVSLEFQIPLGRDWMDAFKPHRRHLVEHLAEPVHRQNDAIKIGNTTTQQTTMMVAHSSTQSTMTANQLLKADIVFVNSGSAVGNGVQAGSASGNGTAQNPFNTIQAGANLAGANSTSTGNLWTAYVQGGGPTYNETVTAAGSTSFFGSSQAIQGLGGKIFGGTGSNPVLNGSIVADASKNPAIKTVNIQGFTILNGDVVDGFAPIAITDVKHVSITNNIIQNSNGDGIDVTVENSLGALSSNVLIAGNTISNPAFAGVSLVANDGGASLIALVQNNTISGAQGDGIDLLATGSGGTGAQIQATITGNTIASPAGYGVSVEIDNDGTTGAVAINNNTITNAGIAGIAGNTFGASTLTLTTANNVISNAVTGFDLTTNDNSTLNFTASGNQITAPSQAGFILNSGDTSTFNATLTNNSVTNSSSDGVDIQGQGNSMMTLTMSGNTISAPSGNGFSVQLSNSAQLTATLSGNNISGSNSGAEIFLSDASQANITVSGNQFSGTGFGLVILADTTGSLTSSWTGNAFSVGSTSMELFAESSGVANLTITGNSVQGSTAGVAVDALDSAQVTATIFGNTFNQITGASSGGIAGASFGATGSLTLNINSNVMTNFGSTATGLLFDQSAGTLSVNPSTSLTNNTVSGATQVMKTFGTVTGSIEVNGTIYSPPTNVP